MDIKYRIKKTWLFLIKPPRIIQEMSSFNRQSNQDKLIKAAITNSINNSISITGNVSSLFLLTLGANPLHIGIRATLTQSYPFIKMLGLKVLPFLGRARLCAWGRVLAVIPLLGLALISLHNKKSGRIVILAIILYALRGFLVTFGNTSWQPLIQESILQEETGVFIARMRIKLRVVDVVFPIVLGVFLGTTPSVLRFAPMFILAAIVSIVGAYFFAGLVETRIPKRDKPLLLHIVTVLWNKSLQRYGLFVACQSFVSTASVPLWVVFLKSCNLPANQVVWLGTISAIGSIIGIGRWGQESDKRGSRWVMSVAMIPMAGLSILWILAPIGGIQLFIWAAFLYLVNGFLGSGLELAKTRAMVQAVPFESQAEGFTMAFYFQAIGGGIGGVLGGLIFNKLSENSGSFLGLSYRQLYLAFMQFLTLPVWLLSRNLRDRFSGGRELTNSDMPVNN